MLQTVLLFIILGCAISLLIILILILLKLIDICRLMQHVKPQETRCMKELVWAVDDVHQALDTGNHQVLKCAINQLEVRAAKVREAGLA